MSETTELAVNIFEARARCYGTPGQPPQDHYGTGDRGHPITSMNDAIRVARLWVGDQGETVISEVAGSLLELAETHR